MSGHQFLVCTEAGCVECWRGCEHHGPMTAADPPDPRPVLPINDTNGPWCGCGQPLGHAVPNVDCDPAPQADAGPDARSFTRWFLSQERGVQADWMRSVAPSLSDLTGWSGAAPQADAGTLREAAAEIVRLGNQPGMDDDEWEAAMTALEAALAASSPATAGLDVERLVVALRAIDQRIAASDPENAVELTAPEAEAGRRSYAVALAAEYDRR